MIRGLSETFTETDPLRTIELEVRIDGIGMWGSMRLALLNMDPADQCNSGHHAA